MPSIDQILLVLRAMPISSPVEKRNRALIAFALLTGARDRAIASFKLKHIDLTQRLVIQDAREVQTKFSKTFPTWFFPVGDEIRSMVEGWVSLLREELHCGPEDPLFPGTKVALGRSNHFEVLGIERKHWRDAGPIRAIFKQSFEAAGLPYFNPHSFRKTLAQLGERICRTPEEFKAWSQNLGHDHVMTTFSSYGAVPASRQSEIIRQLQSADRNQGAKSKEQRLLEAARASGLLDQEA